MNTVEQEIIEKFNQLQPDAKERVFEFISIHGQFTNIHWPRNWKRPWLL